ncbi:MAG: SpoIID/LytB domain-containing protein [Jatrophihabitans sp.]
MGVRLPVAVLRPGRGRAWIAVLALLAGTATLLGVRVAPAGAAEITPVPASGSWTVDGHGNGHGHGLSQYGARGAAIAGLSYDKILGFYYPGTTLTTGSAVTIRVQLSAVGADPAVAAEAGLTVTGVSGALPTAGVDQYRLAPISGGFQLQRHLSGVWRAYHNIPAGKLDFKASDGTLTVQRSSGARVYRGSLSVIEVGSAAIAVNNLGLDDYVRGVVPSEMPASWQAAAVQSQAVAARSYARYFVNHPRDVNYDICDTTSCQVYGGLSAEQAASNDAVTKTANKVLTYAGSTIFAEFSASNGGMTSAGNQPYFVTKVDPYDNAASGDPYLNWTVAVPASRVASYYGLASVSQLQITGRAGGGQWGGLVTTGIVNGTNPGGGAAAVDVTGPGLASAMGLSYSFFHVRTVLPVGHLDSAVMTALHTMTLSGWALDLGNGGTSSSVSVQLDAGSQTVLANLARPDVQSAYHTTSANHGFQTTVTVPGGTHRVCVYALALSSSDRFGLGCKSVTVPVNPLGQVDSLSNDGQGNYRLQGWTFDPDVNGGPSQVRVYVDSGGSNLPVQISRPDVQSAYGLANDQVGFDVILPVPAGTHQLCARAVNAAGTPGATQPLRCYTITR